MSISPKTVATLKTIVQTLGYILFAACVLFFQPISWLLALMCVVFTLGSCVSELSGWAAAFCFASLFALHLFIMFYPTEKMERRLGLQKRARRI